MRVPSRDVVVVGASAGGVEALRAMVAGFPADLPATVLVVLHVPPGAASILPRILTRSGPLPARHAVDGEPLAPGEIVVAPADHHLLIMDGLLRLSHGPQENGHRPAIDPLFRSAARAHGPRVVGVVLSGARDDGSAGLRAVVDRGGTAVVQDPADALDPAMPRSALDRCDIDFVAPAARLGQLLGELAGQPVEQPEKPAENGDRLLTEEVRVAAMLPPTLSGPPGRPAGLACPSCHGGLFEVPDGPLPRYRCWVGHAWSAESLLGEHDMALEGALWMALRALEEKAALSDRMAAAADRRGSEQAARRYRALGDQAQQARKRLRDVLPRLGTGPAVDAE